VFGALATQLWSFAGKNDREDVSLTTFQPFVTYNFEHGWYVSSSPAVTANWEADGNDNTFTVPVGGGFGRLIRTADWTLRLQVQFLFPKRLREWRGESS
jgi:hypothetical protein